MKKLIKWAFMGPIFLFALWIIGFGLPNFRQELIDETKKLLNKQLEEE